MFNLLKNVKNLAIVAATSNFNWLVDNRNLISNVAKVIVLTAPALQKELKKQYRGSDIYFKYIDEMAEAAQICDCAMFVNVNKDIEKEYLRLAKKHNILKYIIVPKGSDYNNLIVGLPVVNGCEYEMLDITKFSIAPDKPIVIEYIGAEPFVSKKEVEDKSIKEGPKKEEEIKVKKPFSRGKK